MDDFLAFVDSLELSDTDATSGSSDCVSPPQRNQPPWSNKLPGRHALKNRKSRKRANLSSSTRLQQTKRAEKLFLRRRILELEEQITQLKIAQCSLRPSRPRRGDQSAEKTKSKWVELAEAEYEARLESEKTNHALKTIMVKQMQATMSLQASLLKQAAANEMDQLQVYTLLPSSSSLQRSEDSTTA